VVEAAHKSGINSLATHQLSTNSRRYLVVSGGDDNALTVHSISLESAQSPSFNILYRHSTAHSAQITGVYIVNDSLLVSVSIDQRVSVWRLDCQSETAQLHHLQTVLTDVADVVGLETFPLIHSKSDVELALAVHGIGVQFLRLRLMQ
jgi:hypothetical protein